MEFPDSQAMSERFLRVDASASAEEVLMKKQARQGAASRIAEYGHQRCGICTPKASHTYHVLRASTVVAELLLGNSQVWWRELIATSPFEVT